jgi:hypothetical protein
LGQLIEIDQVVQLGDVLLISTDRSLSGQDGETYRPIIDVGSDDVASSEVGDNPTFPAKLSVRLFESDPKIEHVYVMSNTVSIGRTGGWDETAIEGARQVVSTFFRFYRSDQTAGESS